MTRRAGRVGVLLTVLLGSTLVMQAGTPAHALNAGHGLKMSGAQRVAAVPRVLGLTTPLGLAVNTAFVAVATADVWLPYVRGALGDGNPRGGDAPAGVGCVSVVDFTSPFPWDDDGTTADGVGVRMAWTNCGAQPMSSGTVNGDAVYALQCRSLASGSYVTSTSTIALQIGVQLSGTVGQSLPGCQAGFVPSRIDLGPAYNAVPGGNFAVGSTPIYWETTFAHEDTAFTSKMTCKRTDGTTFDHVVTATGADVPGIPVPSCESQVVGARPVTLEVRGGPNGAPGTAPVVQTIQYPQTSTDYPDCVTGELCVLAVYVDGAACTVGAADCVNWTTLLQSAPSRVECRWGAYVMPLNDCALLEKAYQTGGVTVDAPGDVDGVPDTDVPDPQPSPVPGAGGIDVVNNPDGSKTETQTRTLPDGSTQTTTTTTMPDGSMTIVTRTVAPDGTVSESTAHVPAPASSTFPGSGTNPDSEGCLAAEWSWNPVSWVYAPVKCALQWAFVPQNLGTSWDAFRADVGGAAPWSYIVAGPEFLDSVLGGFDAPASCTGTTTGNGSLGLPLDSLQPWCALDPDDGAGAFTVGSMRVVATAGIWITFLWACYHRAKRLIGDQDAAHAMAAAEREAATS